jgi:hypothetical protein
MRTLFWWEKLKENNDLGVDGRIILSGPSGDRVCSMQEGVV